MTEDEPPPEALDKFLIQIAQDIEESVKSFETIVKSLESRSKLTNSSHLLVSVFMQRSWRVLRNGEDKLHSAKAFIYLHLFERYKLKNRLSRPGIGCPVSGDVDAFEYWKKIY
jgi:hypothetical protein